MNSSSLLLVWFSLAAVPDVPAPESMPERAPASPLSAGEEAKRDALTRYGLGIHTAHNERLTLAAKQFQAAAERDPKAAAPHRELARVYADLGRDASAIREAREALALDPDDYHTAFLLGKLLMEGHKYADAVAAYRIAAESFSIHKVAPQQFAALSQLAHAAAKANDHPTVEAAVMRALAVASKDRAILLLVSGGFTPRELDRKRVELYEALGEAQIARKKFDSAVAAFEMARDLSLDKNGANLPAGIARIHLNLSKVYEAQNDRPKALAELEKYLAFRPTNAAEYERYAALLNGGRGDDVRPALRALARANPKNVQLKWLIAGEDLRDGDASSFPPLVSAGGDAECYRILVKAYLDAKKYGGLLKLLDDLAQAARGTEDTEEKSKPKKPANVDAVEQVRFLHAAIKAERGHTQALVAQLAADFVGSTKHADETLELMNYLATRDGHQDELTAALQTALGTTNGSPDIYNLLFENLLKRRQWRSLADLTVAAKNERAMKDRSAPHYYAATAYAELGDQRESLKNIDYLISFAGADNRLGYKLEKAHLLGLLGQHRETLKLCGDLRSEFTAPSAQRRITILEADAHHKLKDSLKAEGMLRELLADDPDDVLVLNNLGYNLADQSRKLAEAETMIRRAIELDRDERLRVTGTPEADRGTYLDSLGWVLFRRGELEKAREVLLKATQLPDSAPDAVVWDHLGDVHYRLNQKTEAKKAWQKAVELYKDSHQGREAGRMDEVNKKLKLP
jgi:tetratricopeptide (TPR) repeat protein